MNIMNNQIKSAAIVFSIAFIIGAAIITAVAMDTLSPAPEPVEQITEPNPWFPSDAEMKELLHDLRSIQSDPDAYLERLDETS